MKPPSSWTPDEAKEVEDYLRETPDDTDAALKYAQYKMKQDERASYDKSTSFKPEHNPGGVAGLRMLLPAGLGGSQRTFVEPSKQEFESTVKLAEGEDPAQAYQDFKDQKWTEAVNHARQMGLPIVRGGMTQEGRHEAEVSARHAIVEHPGKSLLGITAKGLTGYTLPGADELAAGGLEAAGAPGAAKYLREAEDMVGPLGTAAEVGGALLPGSLVGKAAGALRGALGPAKGVLGELAKGAVAGAGTGALAGATGDVTHAAGKALSAPEMSDQEAFASAAPPKSSIAKDMLADMAMKTPGRLAIGGILGLLPAGGAALRAANRDLAGNAGQREFAAIEAAGGTGLKTPPGVKAVKPGLYEHPTDLIIEQAAPKIAKAVLARVKPPTPVADTMNVSAKDLMPELKDPEELVNTVTGLEPITHRGTAWAHSERSPGPPPSGAEPLAPEDTLRESPATAKEPVTPVQPPKHSATAFSKTLPSGETPPSIAAARSDMNKQLDEVSRLLKGAGIKTFDMDPNNPELLQEIRQALHKAHFGEGSTEHNRALQALAGNDQEAVKALADVLAAKAVAKGAVEGGVPGVPINPLRWPGAVASAASKNRYRMDPVAGLLAGRAGLSGEANKVADPLTQALIDLQTRSSHP